MAKPGVEIKWYENKPIFSFFEFSVELKEKTPGFKDTITGICNECKKPVNGWAGQPSNFRRHLYVRKPNEALYMLDN